mgnify:CR=1 FL=1|jgi:hypothetical protein
MKVAFGAVILLLCASCNSEKFSEVDPLGKNQSLENSVTSLQSDNWKSPITDTIASLMAAQEVCWNKADLVCFMEPYCHSDEMMFIGKSGVNYGWQKTLDNYIASYPDAKAMGQLRFDNLLIDPLSAEHCYVIGKWHLTREEGDLEGHYTLMWKVVDGRWVIVSDHSS